MEKRRKKSPVIWRRGRPSFDSRAVSDRREMFHFVVSTDHHGRDVVLPVAVTAVCRRRKVERRFARTIAKAICRMMALLLVVHLKGCLIATCISFHWSLYNNYSFLNDINLIESKKGNKNCILIG
jgi:hypothetical protein